MSTVLILNILVVLSAYLARYKDYRFGLKISFILIFLFLSLRYNFGNDYMSYYSTFLSLNSYSSINYFDKSFHFEAGWLLLCRVFSSVGFFTLVIVLAAFNCIVYYWFIKRYVPVQYYWLAVFFYVFTPGFMLVHASAMRQSIAIALFLISVPYIYKKKPIQYFVLVGIAYLFHSSALTLMPIYFIGVVNWKINTKISIVLLLIFLFLFIFGNLIAPFINNIVNNYFPTYETYSGDSSSYSSGLGIIFMSIILIFTLVYSKYQIKESEILFKLSILGFMFIPLGLLILMISRIGMYFTPATIVVYPIIAAGIKHPLIKKGFSYFLVIFTLYTFVLFFKTGIFAEKFSTYQTIFSAPPVSN